MPTRTAVAAGARAGQKAAQQKNSPIYQSVDELACEIGISRQSAYAGLRNNTIPHIRLGKRYILPKAAIAEWLRNPGAFESLGANAPLPKGKTGLRTQ